MGVIVIVVGLVLETTVLSRLGRYLSSGIIDHVDTFKWAMVCECDRITSFGVNRLRRGRGLL